MSTRRRAFRAVTAGGGRVPEAGGGGVRAARWPAVWAPLACLPQFPHLCNRGSGPPCCCHTLLLGVNRKASCAHEPRPSGNYGQCSLRPQARACPPSPTHSSSPRRGSRRQVWEELSSGPGNGLGDRASGVRQRQQLETDAHQAGRRPTHARVHAIQTHVCAHTTSNAHTARTHSRKHTRAWL